MKPPYDLLDFIQDFSPHIGPNFHPIFIPQRMHCSFLK